jgi:hypothetical protein
MAEIFGNPDHIDNGRLRGALAAGTACRADQAHRCRAADICTTRDGLILPLQALVQEGKFSARSAQPGSAID